MVRAVTGPSGSLLAFVGCPWPVSGSDADRVVVVGAAGGRVWWCLVAGSVGWIPVIDWVLSRLEGY